MTGLSRRRLLAGTGTAFAAALAGCSSSTTEDDSGNGDGNGNGNGNGSRNGDEDESTGTGDETDDGSTGDGADDADDGEHAASTVLGEISIENVHSETHTVDVIVEFDGEIEHWTTHELESGSGTTLERDWPTESGSFRAIARLDGDEVTQVEPAKWNDPDCLNLFALVDRDGELTLLGDTDGGPCGNGESEFGGE